MRRPRWIRRRLLSLSRAARAFRARRLSLTHTPTAVQNPHANCRSLVAVIRGNGHVGVISCGKYASKSVQMFLFGQSQPVE